MSASNTTGTYFTEASLIAYLTCTIDAIVDDYSFMKIISSKKFVS